ncbi:MAG: hypothetical protein M1429_04080 [Patescibacteria group bacterium]|nr:hypothetical protein [Patescibacteria group bacterium]
MNKKIDKEKWAKLLASKTPETHAAVMQKLGITPEEDRRWHEENGGESADFSKLKSNS